MWLRDLVDRGETLALKTARALHLPGFILVLALSFWETVYCIFYRFLSSECCAEQKINQYVRAHRNQAGDECRVAVVTGANGGIGFETAKALGRAGYKVILACRNLKRGQQALHALGKETGLQGFEMMELDLSSFMSIGRFVTEFRSKHSKLHVLVCNAGVAFGHYDTTYDGLESQFGTNFVGHYALVNGLLDALKNASGARITIASSIAACMVQSLDYTRVTDVWRFNRFVNYSTSKLALLVFSNALARRLKDCDVTVNAFHPGLVATGLYRNVLFSTLPGIHDLRKWLWLDQVSGSVTSVQLALDPNLSGKTGMYYAREQPAVMHPDAQNTVAQDRLCKFTDVLIATNTHAPNLLESINASHAK